MAWYWPFKRKSKHTPARNGGHVAATVETPIEEVTDHVSVAQTDLGGPRTVEEYVASQIKAEAVANPDRVQVVEPVRLLPAEYRFKVGDRVLTVNGSHVWTVIAVTEDYSEVAVSMRDSRGRSQVKRYHPSRLARSQQV